jgi:uncharacterized PurR-regulated membrane protein YhhQ (DUF165 family)
VLWFLLYLATVVLANVAVVFWGLVPVGFGLYAPAGVYFAGLALSARDMTQDALGRKWVVGAILLGAALSALLSPALALASATAFLVSEFADYAIYTPLRERRWLTAVTLSNVAGAVADSVIFLWLAFGSLALLPGQVLGKLLMTALAVVALAVARKRQTLS